MKEVCIRFISLTFIVSLLYNGVLFQEISECNIEICSGTSTNHTVIKKFCENFGYLDGRCCFNKSILIGLDLSNCSLTSLHNKLINFTSLQYLDLTDNLLNCSKDDFHGLTKLEYLYLPETCECPGNETAWNNTINFGNVECIGERNPCHYLNVSCTDTGYCLHTGPGSAECDCCSGYYGYRCLRKGKFPYAVFFSLMTVLTILLSSLFWYFMRRHVNKCE